MVRDEFGPALEIGLAAQQVALAGIAGAVGQHEVMREVARVSRPRNEMIDGGRRRQVALAIEAPPVLQFPQRFAHLERQRRPIRAEQELRQAHRAAQHRLVLLERQHEPQPLRLCQPTNERSPFTQVARDARQQRDAVGPGAGLVQEPDVLVADSLESPQRHGLEQ